MIVNGKQLADFFGFTQPMITRWKNDGCPYIAGKNQKDDQYETKAVIDWFLNKNTPDNVKRLNIENIQARTRLANAQANKFEFELETSKGLWIESKKIDDLFSKVVNATKTALLSLPKKFSSVFDSIGDAYEMESMLEEEIHSILQELFETKINIDT